MITTARRQDRRQGFTLEKAIVLALFLHVFAASVITLWPGLLYSADLAPLEDRPPLEFRFVDTPDREPPAETPDTEVLSDRDRQAQDDSPIDDREDPFAEGNTAQAVLRPAPPPAETTTPESVEAVPQPPVEEPQPETTPDPVEEPTEEPTENTSENAATTEEAAARPAENESAATPTLPPPRRGLQNSLARLESFVSPQSFDNPEGGAAQPGGLADFDTRGYDLGAYLRQVLQRIEGHWRANMPPLIRTGISGATFTGLSIQRQRRPDGTEAAVIVVLQTWTSGQPAYDQGALFALELSNPLPPIPDYYPYDTIEGRLGFLYNLDPSQVQFPQQ